MVINIELDRWKKLGVAGVRKMLNARAAAKEADMYRKTGTVRVSEAELQERYRRGEDPYSAIDKDELPPLAPEVELKHSAQYERAKQVMLDFFADLPYSNGRLLYLAIGTAKPGFRPAVGRLVRKLDLCEDMLLGEKSELRAWICNGVDDAWKYFFQLSSRSQG